MGIGFGMHAARRTKGKGYELVPEAKWYFINMHALQELMDMVGEESDEDGETVFNFDWFDTALDANVSQTPTAKTCRHPEEMLEILGFVQQRIKANPPRYKIFEADVEKMVALCDEAARNGHLVHTALA